MRMTLDSICKVGFGVEIGTLAPNLPDNQFAKSFDAANIIVTLRFIDPLWKIKKFLRIGSEAVLDQSMKIIDDFTYSVIRRRKKEIEEAQEVPSRVPSSSKVNTSIFFNGLVYSYYVLILVGQTCKSKKDNLKGNKLPKVCILLFFNT